MSRRLDRRYRALAVLKAATKLVLEYSAAMSRTSVEVSDLGAAPACGGLFAAVQRHFDTAQRVEPAHVIALENLRARFNLALGIGAAGFSEGAVCARPD